MPEKILKFLPEKKKSPREKIRKSARENFKLTEKYLKKVGEKNNFRLRKKPKKYQKPVSRALFIFSGKKKTLFARNAFVDRGSVLVTPKIMPKHFLNNKTS